MSVDWGSFCVVVDLWWAVGLDLIDLCDLYSVSDSIA